MRGRAYQDATADKMKNIPMLVSKYCSESRLAISVCLNSLDHHNLKRALLDQVGFLVSFHSSASEERFTSSSASIGH